MPYANQGPPALASSVLEGLTRGPSPKRTPQALGGANVLACFLLLGQPLVAGPSGQAAAAADCRVRLGGAADTTGLPRATLVVSAKGASAPSARGGRRAADHGDIDDVLKRSLDPGCQGSLLRYSFGDGRGQSRLLFLQPGWRANLTVP